jgi:putative glutamine amidotransferase
VDSTDVTDSAGPDRPVIGISCYAQPASWGSWERVEANLLPRRYADAVAQAGGLPVLLPPVPGIADVTGCLDGLLLSGGGDIDPARYREARHDAGDRPNIARDEAEFALGAAALAAGLPLLAICRGLQVVNVMLGGTLHQHLPDVVGSDLHSPLKSGYGSHDVSVTPGSVLAAALGRTTVGVPTHHHQAVAKLGAGLVATAWTADGVVEAVEFETGEFSAAGDRSSFMLAVQWHPETGDDPSLFEALVAAAAARRQLPAPA